MRFLPILAAATALSTIPAQDAASAFSPAQRQELRAMIRAEIRAALQDLRAETTAVAKPRALQAVEVLPVRAVKAVDPVTAVRPVERVRPVKAVAVEPVKARRVRTLPVKSLPVGLHAVEAEPVEAVQAEAVKTEPVKARRPMKILSGTTEAAPIDPAILERLRSGANKELLDKLKRRARVVPSEDGLAVAITFDAEPEAPAVDAEKATTTSARIETRLAKLAELEDRLARLAKRLQQLRRRR